MSEHTSLGVVGFLHSLYLRLTGRGCECGAGRHVPGWRHDPPCLWSSPRPTPFLTVEPEPPWAAIDSETVNRRIRAASRRNA